MYHLTNSLKIKYQVRKCNIFHLLANQVSFPIGLWSQTMIFDKKNGTP